MQEETYEVDYLNLKRKYDLEYEQLYQQIAQIINGSVSLPAIKEEEFTTYKIEKKETANESGIPDYWAITLKNSALLYVVNENDEKILKHCTEVKLIQKEDKLSYTVEFHFSPNSYFSDSVLKKTYNYSLNDHQICGVEYCNVNWKSEDVKPNKITKTKTIKSILFLIFRGKEN